MAHPATLNITSWELTPINPNGTINTNISPLTGSVPTTELCDFACMGQRMRLTLECEMHGHYDTGGSVHATVIGTTVRFNPALFAEAFSTYPFAGGFPSSGYSIVIPSATATTYSMALTFPNGQFTNSNENGSCSIQVVNSTHFVITYNFRMTFDVLGYLTGRSTDNRFRLTKNSTANSEQLNNSFVSVYGNLKALNAYVATKQTTFVLTAPELSLQFKASFNSTDANGNSIFPMEVIFRDTDEPSGTVDHILAFKDTEVTLRFQDPSALIRENETAVILTRRNLGSNVAGYEKDLDLKEVLLVTTGSTGTISGPFKGPVAYSYGSGVTDVTFTLDHTQLEYNNPYDLHALNSYDSGPSQVSVVHGVSSSSTGTESPENEFTMTSKIYSRNGKFAESFGATVMERLVCVCSMDRVNYNENATVPYSDFDDDIQSVTVELKNAFGVVLFSHGILKNSNDNTWTETDRIKVVQYGDDTLFVLKEWRVPYLNEQGLPDLGINEENVYEIEWKVNFIASNDDVLQSQYQCRSELTVRPYENSPIEPSGAPKVNNIRFLDVNTGFPIGAWCEDTEVLVLADVEDLGEDTYVQVFVDKSPYGSLYNNDVALEEQDPAEHSGDLPSYVEFTQKTTDLVSLLDAEVTDGTISFRLDISDVSGSDQLRISVFAYQATPPVS